MPRVAAVTISPLYHWLGRGSGAESSWACCKTAFAGVDTLLGLWWQTAVSGAQFLGTAGGIQDLQAVHTPQQGTLPLSSSAVRIEVVYSQSAIKPELFSL